MHVKIPVSGQARALLDKIAELSGQNVFKCMQCATCSAVCPMAPEMDLTPRAAVALLHFGMVDEVVASKVPWLCASCHSCQVRCPRGIELPRVMEALRQLRLRGNEDMINPRALSAEVLAQAPQIAFVSTFRKLTA